MASDDAAAPAAAAANETTPLLGTATASTATSVTAPPPRSRREDLFLFLEAKTPRGRMYEIFIIALILINVLSFILASLFVEAYNPDAAWAKLDGGICNRLCDALWFGNYQNNGLEFLNIGSTSVLEIFTVAVFTIEYSLRLYTADLENPIYSGFWGRIRYIPTFYSLVDLASTVPFFVDAFVLRHSDLAASSFLRMFRLFRMMRVEGRYKTALTLVDDVFAAQKGILGTALFVGVTTWMTVSSLYYVVERRNKNMIYCGRAPDYCGDPDDIDVSLCVFDPWGFADCSAAGCPDSNEYPQPCYNLYQSIPMASYYALLNLFGEFPLMVQHSVGGKFVGTFTAAVAVAFFALPAGIVGNGFERVIAEQRTITREGPIVEEGIVTRGFSSTAISFRGRLYNLLHAQTAYGSTTLDLLINLLILVSSLTFMVDTVTELPPSVHQVMNGIEFASVIIFTIEYALRVYSVKEDAKYRQPGGRLLYMTKFLALVDLLSFLPYWIQVAWTGKISLADPYTSTANNLVSALRLLRLLRFERYTHAFTSFDDVLSRNLDILAVTAFSALLFWVFFGAFLYFTERDNPDPEMASNYNNVPNSMWITLLNLSGESPLAQYSAWGKVATGILGLFATAVFGIPIGVLGAGFESVVEEENKDNTEEFEQQEDTIDNSTRSLTFGSSFEQSVWKWVNGGGSRITIVIEFAIYILILLTVAVGVWQTVDGQENSFRWLEWAAVIVFTIEYLMRLVAARADPVFGNGRNALTSRLRFIISFYSIIDLLAIVPFYVAMAMPETFVNKYDQYLRMFRILRLIKLDKYVPSISLIDDVIRLKFNKLRVAFYAAVTLWVLFSSLLYVFEYNDNVNGIDNVPFYGCDADCTMADRFQNFFDSMVYTAVHLTGDYPITTYTWPARFVNFAMVLAAVGVVSIPSGLIASGFVEIVQSKNKARNAGKAVATPAGHVAGDDWYEYRYKALEGMAAPRSLLGSRIDDWQVAVNEFLNGSKNKDGTTQWTPLSYASRVFIFVIIIANVLAVLLESIPQIDRMVGNASGNFFDVFEAGSVFIFTAEYFLRLFCAPKNREALYSSFVYATTFFGIVDILSIAPWFVEEALILTGHLDASGDNAKIFRIFRIFRILQLEDFVVAFSKLDNVFRASQDVLKATGLLALIIWVGSGALFYIFEHDNPNWRDCDSSVPANSSEGMPGCYSFASTKECNDYYPGMCSQHAFTNMPDALFFTAVFLGGEWGVVDFTWPGRFVCLFLCVVGIALYAIPIGTLFDSFGAVLGLNAEDEDEGSESGGGEESSEGSPPADGAQPSEDTPQAPFIGVIPPPTVEGAPPAEGTPQAPFIGVIQ